MWDVICNIIWGMFSKIMGYIIRHFDNGFDICVSLGHALYSRRRRRKESISRTTQRRTGNSWRRSRHCHRCLSTIRAQRATCRPSPVARCPLSIAHCLLPVTRRPSLVARCPSRLLVTTEKQRSFPVWRIAVVCATMEVQRLCKGRTITRSRTKKSQDSIVFCLSLSLPLDSSVIDERLKETMRYAWEKRIHVRSASFRKMRSIFLALKEKNHSIPR